MRIRPLRELTVLLAAAAATLAGAATANAAAPRVERPDTFIGTEYGYGPTLADAQQAADSQMNGDYYGCQRPFYLVADGQLSNGTWWAEVKANGCKGYI